MGGSRSVSTDLRRRVPSVERALGLPGLRELQGRIGRAALLRAVRSVLAEARAQGISVVLDVPLLLEGGLVERCDLCIFVEASRESRLARATARGWSPDELARREAHQIDLAVKKQRCAYTMRNDGSIESTDQQVAELIRSLGRDS